VWKREIKGKMEGARKGKAIGRLGPKEESAVEEKEKGDRDR